jgi:hypothetical protein
MNVHGLLCTTSSKPTNASTNIKIGNSHTLVVEEMADALLNALIPDNRVQSDTDYHREITSYVSVPLMPMSTLPSLDEIMNIVRALPTNFFQ